MKRFISLFILVLGITVSLNTSSAHALTSAYYFISDPTSTYDGMATDLSEIPVSYDIFSSASSSLFNTYYICPYVYDDKGNSQLLDSKYCASFYMNGYNSTTGYGQYYENLVGGTVQLPYVGVNNVSCYIMKQGDNEHYQDCGSPMRVVRVEHQYPVYRFWSPNLRHHMLTTDENEKNTLRANAANVWSYEGTAFKVKSLNGCADGEAIYRFYSEALRGHLYTKDVNEKNILIGYNNPSVWRYEGVAYCADSSQTAGTKPVYRFYSEALKSHLYTIDENEKNVLIGYNNPSVWRYEGVAYYAYPQ